MNKDEFFSKIIGNLDTPHAIIAILVARGILIDEDDDGFYLSDNAHDKDGQFLSVGLKKYSLGKLGSCGDVKKKLKIVIDNGANIGNAIRFFESTGRVKGEVEFAASSWSEFCYRVHGQKVPIAVLEPYVGYYVKALSACGVETDFSCDGNHIYGNMIKVHAPHPYEIWHREIYSSILPDDIFPTSIVRDQVIPFNKSNQFDRYYSLYCVANYMYRNRIAIRNIKQQACKMIKKQVRKRQNDDLLEIEFRDAVHKIIKRSL